MARLQERGRRTALRLDVEAEGQDIMGRDFFESTRTVNISGGGLCLETRHQVAVGSQLTLAIAVPETLRRHFGGSPIYRARAVVCRVELPDGEGLRRVGARILGELLA